MRSKREMCKDILIDYYHADRGDDANNLSAASNINLGMGGDGEIKKKEFI